MLIGAALVIPLLTSIGVTSSAAAAEGAAYGEVERFGGFDVTGSTPGKFVMPVGFAVEPVNAKGEVTNAVWVLDRTVHNLGTGELDYRLQKLSTAAGKEGEVLGETSWDEKFSDTNNYTDAHPLISLAVDPAKERVYSIVQSVVNAGGGDYGAVADELVAWSTKPNGTKIERADPAEYTADTITNGSLVAGEAALMPSSETSSEMLFAPSGLVVDPETSGKVVIEARKGIEEETGGPIELQQVGTEGPTKGVLGESHTVIEAYKGSAGGLFAATDGYGIDEEGRGGQPSHLVTVGNVFSDPTETELASASQKRAKDIDELVALSFSDGQINSGGEPNGFPHAAASRVAQLDDADHLYASLYAEEGTVTNDFQSAFEPWKKAAGGTSNNLWMQGASNTKDQGWANVGIRLFEADGRIVDTIGGGQPMAAPNSSPQQLLGSCDIDYGEVGIAAGAEGAVVVLTQPNAAVHPDDGDEVVVFAPGGAHKCPSVSGNVEVNGSEVKPEADQTVAKVDVPVDVPTKFNSISLDHQIAWTPMVGALGEAFAWTDAPFEWEPLAFEWNFGDESTSGPNKDGYTVIKTLEPSEYGWPTPEAEHEYKTPGHYEAKVRVYSDLGTSVFPVDVDVTGSEPPLASFECPAEIAVGHLVTCDASASKPSGGTEIENYHWEFVEIATHAKTSANSATPTVQHTFASPGSYEVTLTVKDEAGQVTEASVTHSVTVKQQTQAEEEAVAKKKAEEEAAAAAAKKKAEEEAAVAAAAVKKKAEEEAATKKKAEEAAAAAAKKKAEEEAAKKKTRPLTTAQKLANALKVCKKDKSKKQRMSCEKQAEKKYAAKPKAKTKKSSKKK